MEPSQPPNPPDRDPADPSLPARHAVETANQLTGRRQQPSRATPATGTGRWPGAVARPSSTDTSAPIASGVSPKVASRARAAALRPSTYGVSRATTTSPRTGRSGYPTSRTVVPLAFLFRTTGSPAAAAAARKRATAGAGPVTLTLRPTSRPEHGPETEVSAAAESRRDMAALDPGGR